MKKTIHTRITSGSTLNGARGIWGYARKSNGSSGIGEGIEMRLSINGGAPYEMNTMYSSGENNMYYFLIDEDAIASGDIVTVYMVDDTDTYKANLVTEMAATGKKELNIHDGKVMISASSATITNAEMSTAYVASDSSEMLFAVDGSDKLTVADSDIELEIASGTSYTPGGDIEVAGSWDNNGTFDSGTSTVTFNGTATGKTIAGGTGGFYNLIINGTDGAWTIQDEITIGGDLSIQNNGTLIASSANPLYIRGSWTQGAEATFTANSGTVYLEGDDNLPSGVTFYNLIFGNNGLGDTWTLTSDLTVSNDFTIARGL